MSKPPSRSDSRPSSSSSSGALWNSPASSPEADYGAKLDAATEALMGGVGDADEGIGLDFESLREPEAGPASAPDYDARAAAEAAGRSSDISSSSQGLTLDFQKAGLEENTKGQALANQPRPGAVPAQASQEDIEFARRAGMPVPQASQHRTGAYGTVRTPDSVSLFGLFDRPASVMIGLAIGLLLAVLPASRFGGSVVDEARATLLEELEESVTNPLAVKAGDLRPDREIRRELSTVGEAGQKTFFGWWLGIGLPLGIGLGLVRRKV